MGTAVSTEGTRRVYIIAGEASGDLHGGNLVRALFEVGRDRAATGATEAHPPLIIRAWGGDRMAAAGAEVVKHIRELAFMGFTQVLFNLRTILRNIRWCEQDILRFKPHALVLIDYPGFNLRIATFAKRHGIPVLYYISPQLWAWKAGRIERIRRDVDHMCVILPFERQWYAERGMEVEFVGHPLLDELVRQGVAPGAGGRGDRIALLPGSRRQEISRMLPMMLEASREAGLGRTVACAPGIPDAFYDHLVQGHDVRLVRDRTYAVLLEARAALVTSGTATLEAALIGVPQAVCYSGSRVNVWLARRVVKVPFISLVNLIMGRAVVREMIQQDMTPGAVRAELDRLLNDADYRASMERDLAELHTLLGGPGASQRVADRLWKILGERAEHP